MAGNQKEQNSFEQVLQYWSVVRRHRWWVLFVTLGIGLASLDVIALLQDYYQATTTILVDPQQIPDRYVTSTVIEDPAHRLNTISQEVLSASRLRQIIDQYSLYSGRRKTSFRDEVVELMRKDIAIQVKEGNGSSLSAFTITYRGTNPKIVAQVTNQLASGFIDWNLKNREQQVAGTTDFLKSELDRARENLKDQETKLSQFKIQHAGELPEDQAGNLQMLSQLQAGLQTNREALNRLDMQRTMLLHSAETGVAAGAPAAEPLNERAQLVAERRDLQHKLDDLDKTYTAEFPDIVSLRKRLDQVNARLQQLPAEKPEEVAQSGDNIQLALVDREIGRLNEEQKQIKAQMVAYRAKMEAAPVRQQQILDLTRNYQVSSSDYSSLLEKTSASQLAAELEKRQKGERFTVLDAATVPERPFKPNRPVLMVAAVFGALCLSVVTAVARDTLAGTVQSEHQLLKVLPATVSVLAVVPSIDTPATLRRRRTRAVVATTVIVVAFAVEALFLLKIKPVM